MPRYEVQTQVQPVQGVVYAVDLPDGLSDEEMRTAAADAILGGEAEFVREWAEDTAMTVRAVAPQS